MFRGTHQLFREIIGGFHGTYFGKHCSMSVKLNYTLNIANILAQNILYRFN